jgi:hypothetical protein
MNGDRFTRISKTSALPLPTDTNGITFGACGGPLERMQRTMSMPFSTVCLGVAAIAAIATLSPASAGGNKFKVTNVHFETNSSACDMGIQTSFDTEGLTEGSVTDPNGHEIYSFKSAGGMKATGGQTEGFLEGIEPQIKELMDALSCAREKEEGKTTLADLLAEFPQGESRFSGLHNGVTITGEDKLTYHIPAGAKVVAPANGTILPLQHVLLKWKPVTGPILPYLGPVTITGYHAIVYENGPEIVPQLDVDLPYTQTNLKVPVQYLKRATVYLFEILSTEKSGNQTITEGFFCTEGVQDCQAPIGRHKH